MALKNHDYALRKRALQNILVSIDFNKMLPSQIFRGQWSCFLFCESDRVFVPGFMEFMKELLRAEGSCLSCLINLDETPSFELEKIAAIFLDQIYTEADYMVALEGSGPAAGWRYQMQRFACASDVGEWCLYSEKANDIAVIGIRSEAAVARLKSTFEKLWAWPLSEIVKGGSRSVYPFTHLTTEWFSGLFNNYQTGPNRP
jgi:hypothetical protein